MVILALYCHSADNETAENTFTVAMVSGDDTKEDVPMLIDTAGIDGSVVSGIAYIRRNQSHFTHCNELLGTMLNRQMPLYLGRQRLPNRS